MSPKLRNPPLAVYVHFPWCVRKCPYCDFNSYTLHGTLPESAYLEALERDLASQAPAVAGREIASIFLGGGTPSLFSPRAIGAILEGMRRHLPVAGDAEVTLEANPGTVERGRFAEYRAAGVNRVSLGAQSFDSRRLEQLGRIHSPEETRRATEELHQSGLDNFNLDLMFALPGQDLDGALEDIEEALALAPAHLSHYQLTIEPGTVFAGHPPALPDEDAGAAMLTACQERLAERGYSHYEVSAYSRPAARCRHNLNYWTFGDYVGIGAGAHGKLSFERSGRIVRTVRPREPRRYLAASGGAPMQSDVAPHERPFEFMMNALRLVDGFELDLFEARTGCAASDVETQLRGLERRGLLDREPGRCRASARGLRFLNDVLLELLPSAPARNTAEPDAASVAGTARTARFMHTDGQVHPESAHYAGNRSKRSMTVS